MDVRVRAWSHRTCVPTHADAAGWRSRIDALIRDRAGAGLDAAMAGDPGLAGLPRDAVVLVRRVAVRVRVRGPVDDARLADAWSRATAGAVADKVERTLLATSPEDDDECIVFDDPLVAELAWLRAVKDAAPAAVAPLGGPRSGARCRPRGLGPRLPRPRADGDRRADGRDGRPARGARRSALRAGPADRA